MAVAVATFTFVIQCRFGRMAGLLDPRIRAEAKSISKTSSAFLIAGINRWIRRKNSIGTRLTILASRNGNNFVSNCETNYKVNVVESTTEFSTILLQFLGLTEC